MADLPILFSAPMVRALIVGTKTQTRRAIDPQPEATAELVSPAFRGDGQDLHVQFRGLDGLPGKSQRIRYAVGDRLWVREAWRVSQKWDRIKPSDLPARNMTVMFRAGGSIANHETGGWEDGALTDKIEWRPDHWPPAGETVEWAGKLRPGIFLPRWGSRLTLIVSDVRVQRLQDISEADARAEGIIELQRKGWLNGCPLYGLDEGTGHDTAVGAFNWLWRDINGEGSWAENPWVVAYTFRRIMGNIDHLPVAA